MSFQSNVPVVVVCLALWFVCQPSFAIVSLQWESDVLVGERPSCRSLHTLTAYEPTDCAHLLVFGGFNFSASEIIGSGPLLYRSELWIYRALMQQWVMVGTELFPWPAARGGHSAFLLNTTQSSVMAIYGGCDNVTVFDDMWVLLSDSPCTFSINTDGVVLHSFQWRQVQLAENSSSPAPRWGHVGVLLPCCGYVVFGGFSTALGV